MIGKVIPKNFKIWLKPKAPRPENLERSHSENVKVEKPLKAEDLKLRKSPSTADKDANS